MKASSSIECLPTLVQPLLETPQMLTTNLRPEALLRKRMTVGAGIAATYLLRMYIPVHTLQCCTCHIATGPMMASG